MNEMGNMASLGIDVSKAKLDAVLLNDQQSWYGSFDNTAKGFAQLHRWVHKRHPHPVHACLEATGRYGEGVAEYLYAEGHCLSVVNPARIKAFAQSRLSRNKTDRSDAHLIAIFCQTQQPQSWAPPDPAWKKLQIMVRHLHHLQKVLFQQQNRLPSCQDAPVAVAYIQAHTAFIQQQIDDLEQHIQEHIAQSPSLKNAHDLLVSIPGIAEKTASTILSEIPDVNRFESASQLAAYAGLTPQQHRSGSSVRGRTRISKKGNAHLRKALYFPGLSAKKHNPLIKPLCDRMAERGHCAMSCVVAAMRKLLHLVYGVLTSGMPFDPQYLNKVSAKA